MITNVKVTIGNPADPTRSTEVECLVDSGATYSLVPAEILRSLGIEPHSVREFVLGNGEIVRRKMGTALFEYRGIRGDSLVMFGEPGGRAPTWGDYARRIRFYSRSLSARTEADAYAPLEFGW